MNKKLLAITLCALLPVLAQADDVTSDAPAASTNLPSPELQKKFSYAIGRDFGKGLTPIPEAVDISVLKQGIDDGAASKPSPYTEDEMLTAKTEMGQLLQARMKAKFEVEGAANLKAAQAFLAKNAKRKGVKTTASGLQYEVLTAAKGAHPNAQSNVKVHYRGTLENGTEFDSSYARGVPVEFVLENVIAGWTEGLQLMAPGAKYKFFLSPELAYGDRGVGKQIGPNALLIFEVELISFGEAPPTQQ
ncbi:FKBP-type peptidyl-prolyl cis-trans isomerase [Stenotrophobium rhamnosiphilum]|uniref:Peptidyl-prolyl cis-trans isomerase n=1 Tax=Stenotrophobium rhamnosiphilum TaxID=2029166 RepID=A0A2T5MJB6_9GAMM|nr:FKBP-type peptidyl-prolyl cis-trans isomerase [Stenotrophobium rhamnosiphilum]PTU32648.1 hypothetical protein CJD38_00550 [Stenotrophobium rhamnosiphilum]